MGAYFLLPYAVVVIILLYAIMLGGAPERWVAGACMTALAIDPLYHSFFGSIQFDRFDIGHFLIDGALLVAALMVSLLANRFWPLVAAASQLLSLIGQTNVLFLEGRSLAYWAVTQLPIYLTVLCILIGTINHRKRISSALPVRDWRMQHLRT